MLLQPGSGDLPVREKIQKKWLQYGIAVMLMVLAGAVYLGSQMEKPVMEWQTTEEAASGSQGSVTSDAGLRGQQTQETTVSDGTAGLLSGTETNSIAAVWVYVCGAVQCPGVYELPGDGRIYDAVEAAGGFAEGADECAVNLAEVLTDGSQIYIPTVEESAGLPQSAALDSGESALVNLNTATKAQLMELPGIGEAKAEAILGYRESVGKFSCIEDIMNVSGIKETLFSKIKMLITV